MKVLVTGGAGFVGTHLCQFLLRNGHVVTIYDKLDLRVVNPRALQWTEVGGCKVMEGDIRDEPKLIDITLRNDTGNGKM